MNTLEFKEEFFKSLNIIKNKNILASVHRKIEQLKDHVPIGKKLIHSPYWSIRVEKFRIIYRFKGSMVTIIRLLPRKYDYRELDLLE